MAIERIHEDIDSNRRKRLIMQGSVEDQLALLWQVVLATANKSRLSKALKDKIKVITDAEAKFPEKND